MGELQQLVSQWLSGVSNLLPLGYAFGAGMVSTVNPCGFAMLPVYLGLFLGSGQLLSASGPGTAAAVQVSPPAATLVQMARAVLVALAVTSGFVLLFGGVGLVISAGGRAIVQWVPWVALVVGLLLVVLGLATLRGWYLPAGFAARLANRLGDPKGVSVQGFFVFGLAYAITSLSCTLPVFLTVVGGSLAVEGFASAALQFVSYALGMGLVILVLTLGLAAFKGAAVKVVRKVLPYTERISAALLIVAGGYIVYYWLVKGGLINTFR